MCVMSFTHSYIKMCSLLDKLCLAEPRRNDNGKGCKQQWLSSFHHYFKYGAVALALAI